MRNAGHLLMRSTLRAVRALAVVAALPAGLLLAGGVAFADGTTVQAETNSDAFGVLGPVGLAAVALGIVGMTLGVLRQRRKARAAEAATPAPAVPDAPGAVTAMAEAVLADADQTPTRPILTPRPRA